MTAPAVYDGYLRVSRVAGREGETFISPDVQRHDIEEWARRRGVTIGAWHIDLDVSGAKRERAGLDAAIGRVEHRQTGGIVVSKLDRLARSIAVGFDTIERIEDAGGSLVAVEEGLDPSTPNGQLLRGLLLLMAAWYREQVRASWAEARGRAVARGAYVSPTVPTGYRRSRKGGPLEPDEWADTVRDAFRLRAVGTPWTELADVFNDRGVPVRYAGTRDSPARWTGHTVSQVLASRVYLGESRHGEYVNEAAHEPLVSVATWSAAQAARGVAAPKTDRDPALLAGVLRCSGCGYSMFRGAGRGAGGTRILSYRCRGGGSGGVCPDRAFVYSRELDELVERWLFDHAADLAVRADAGSLDLDAAVDRVQVAEHGLRVFRDDPAVIGALGGELFAEGLRERMRLVDEARGAVAKARASFGGFPDERTLRGLWPSLDVRGRRRLIAAAVDCVVVAGRGPLTADRVRIMPAGTGPRDLPRQGRRGVGLRPIPFDDRMPARPGV